MKAMKTLIASAVLCSLMPSAFAASTVDMTVGGNIVPSACTPSLSTRNVTFGKVSSADLAADKHTDMVSQTSTLSIRCTSPTLYGLRVIDNKPGTHHQIPGWNETNSLGLGLTANDEKIGGYRLELIAEGSRIDDVTPFFAFQFSQGGSWTFFNEPKVDLTKIGGWPWLVGMHHTSGNQGGPAAIETAYLKMNIHGYIAPADGLTLTDDVALDGAATLEVVYL
jgi:hypothetical protein